MIFRNMPNKSTCIHIYTSATGLGRVGSSGIPRGSVDIDRKRHFHPDPRGAPRVSRTPPAGSLLCISPPQRKEGRKEESRRPGHAIRRSTEEGIRLGNPYTPNKPRLNRNGGISWGMARTIDVDGKIRCVRVLREILREAGQSDLFVAHTTPYECCFRFQKTMGEGK